MSSINILKEIRNVRAKKNLKLLNIMGYLNKRMCLQSGNWMEKEERRVKIFGH